MPPKPEAVQCAQCFILVNEWEWDADEQHFEWDAEWWKDPLFPEDATRFTCSQRCYNRRKELG